MKKGFNLTDFTKFSVIFFTDSKNEEKEEEKEKQKEKK